MMMLLELSNFCAFVMSMMAVSAIALPLVNSVSSSSQSNVHVYDNAITAWGSDTLHSAASKSGLGHKYFSRPLKMEGDVPIIEQALDNILSELGDIVDENNIQYVEYWTRQEWRHIESHADVDEHLAKEQDILIGNGDEIGEYSFRYPENGHVLYLKVGSEVRGPTCVFPEIETGGSLLQQPKTEVITVPAVPGRLLRFNGSLLHSVPRPADLWLLPFVQGAPKHEPEEMYGRSVILFNTWLENPPKDVPQVVEKNHKDDGIDYGPIVNKKEVWEKQSLLSSSCDSTTSVEDPEEEDMGKIKIWLLGNPRRRDHPLRAIKMKARRNIAKKAFMEERKVSSFSLEQV